MDNIKIECPKCKWKPDGQPHWVCTCGCIWDTFSTGAKCPKCGKVWSYTQCVSEAGGCDKTSPHLDWYNGLDDVINALKEEIKENWKEKVLV